MRPLVSCALPVFNAEAYLREAMESVLAQKGCDFELIVVNDGSTDGSAAIIADLASRDDRIRVIEQENSGIVSALNKALDAARGTYLARMDADDVCYPDRFQLQSNYLESHPHVAVVGGSAVTIDADGQEKQEGVSARTYRQKASLDKFPPKVAVSLHPLIMTRTDLLRQIGGYSADYPHAEDYDIFIRLGEHGEIHNPDFRVLKYRVHGENISIRNLEQQELSASRSELSNLNRLCQTRRSPVPKIGKSMFQAYVDTRIARRKIALNQHVEFRQFTNIAGNIIKGATGTTPYTTIRVSAIAGFNFIRWIRNGAA